MTSKLKYLLPGLVLLAGPLAQAQPTPVFRNVKQPISARVNDLISKLTLAERPTR
jgi:hypothetical protein